MCASLVAFVYWLSQLQMIDCLIEDTVDRFTKNLPIPPNCFIVNPVTAALNEPFKSRVERHVERTADSVASLIESIEGSQNISSSNRCYYSQCFTKLHKSSIRTVCGLICCSIEPTYRYSKWQEALCDTKSHSKVLSNRPNYFIPLPEWSLIFQIDESSKKASPGDNCCTFDVRDENWKFIQCLATLDENFFLPIDMQFVPTSSLLSMARATSDKTEDDHLLTQNHSSVGTLFPQSPVIFIIKCVTLFVFLILTNGRYNNSVRSLIIFYFAFDLTHSDR